MTIFSLFYSFALPRLMNIFGFLAICFLFCLYERIYYLFAETQNLRSYDLLAIAKMHTVPSKVEKKGYVNCIGITKTEQNGFNAMTLREYLAASKLRLQFTNSILFFRLLASHLHVSHKPCISQISHTKTIAKQRVPTLKIWR